MKRKYLWIIKNKYDRITIIKILKLITITIIILNIIVLDIICDVMSYYINIFENVFIYKMRNCIKQNN